MMGFPSNETEVIELFRLIQDRLGWRIAYLQTAFPDAIIESEDGDRLIVEFEYHAKDFKYHGHDPDGCDLIICWRNNWLEAPLPIQALEICAYNEVKVLNSMFYRFILERERCKAAERKSESLVRKFRESEQEIERLKTVIESMKNLKFKITAQHDLSGIATFYTNTVRDCEQINTFIDLVLATSEGQAIFDWMGTADIPNKEQTDLILAKQRRHDHETDRN